MSKLLVPLAVAGVGLLMYTRLRDQPRAHSRSAFPSEDSWRDSKRATGDRPNIIDRAADKIDDTMTDFGRSVDKGVNRMDRKLERGVDKARDMTDGSSRSMSSSPSSSLSRDMGRLSDKVKEGMSDVGDSMDRGAQRMGQKMDRGISDVGDSIDRGAQRMGQKMDRGVDKAQSTTGSLTQNVKKAVSDTIEKVEEKIEDVGEALTPSRFSNHTLNDSRSNSSSLNSSNPNEYSTPYASSTIDNMERDMKEKARNWRHNWHIGENKESSRYYDPAAYESGRESGRERDSGGFWGNRGSDRDSGRDWGRSWGSDSGKDSSREWGSRGSERRSGREWGRDSDRDWDNNRGYWQNGPKDPASWEYQDKRYSDDWWSERVPRGPLASDTTVDNTRTLSHSDIPNNPGMYHSVVLEKDLHGTDSLRRLPPAMYTGYEPIEKMAKENKRQRDYLVNELQGLLKEGTLPPDAQQKLKDVLDTSQINYLHQKEGLSYFKGAHKHDSNGYNWFQERQRAR